MRALTASVGLGLTLTAILAGCLGGEEDPQGPLPDLIGDDWVELAVPFGEGHDHNDPAQHAGLSTPNWDLLGWDPLITDYHGASSGDYFCADAGSLDGRQIAVSHSFNSDVALVVVDVTDPAAPKLLGELVLPNTHVWDLAMLPDASYAVLATSPMDPGTDAPPAGSLYAHDRVAYDALEHAHDGDDHDGHADDHAHEAAGHDAVLERLADGHTDAHAHGPTSFADGLRTHTLRPIWRDACGNEYQGPADEVPYTSGVVLVDLSDLSTPEVVDYAPQPILGGHSIHAQVVDGTRYVVVSVTNLFDQNSYFSVFTVEEASGRGKLAPFAAYSASQPDTITAVNSNGHVDAWIQPHPLTGDVLVYLADYNNGLVILNLSPEGQLTRVGQWNDYNPDLGGGMTGEIHTVLPIEGLRDGRHYTIAGQEVTQRPAGRPSGQIVLVDTTDPSDPVAVARWTLPTDLEWGPDSFLLFSPHYVEVVGDYLYVSHWHAGLYATKITPDQWPELPTLGVFVPDQVSPAPPPTYIQHYQRWTPHVMDVVATETGDLVSFDGQSGVYVLRFDPTVDVPLPEPWLEDAWLAPVAVE